ncbi:hypothetical protein FIV42_15050 [Persicimonas caeni]|uniref:Tetratricopeptide repeat protein n=1 Tax=Persicimonas caeni TaxID=2292766 RepID=A0A4Y6PV70_PERCE|nr:tetratricopeptide repeat protein [Persicimonas caeni]QDG52009.1 hypothetical protein FIV42_15050 [Persicimonas caeni]QED33230.1 hypothetical protein FRD00_15045 [Persicimonas caeni]
MKVRRQLVAWIGAGLMLAAGTPAFAQDSKQQQKAPAAESEAQGDADKAALDLLETAQKQYQAGKWEQARESYKKAYDTAPDDSRLKAQAALEWSSLLWEQGDYAAADKRVDDALRRARKLKMNEAVGRLLLTQGHIQASQGKLRKAENTLKICINLTSEQNDEVFGALCKLNHRLVRQLRGRPAGPDSDYKKAIAQLEAAGTPLSVGSALAKTAGLYAQGGNPAKALELLKRAQQSFSKADSVPAQLRNRLRIAKLLQEQGQHAQADKYLEGLVGKFSAMNNRPALVDALVLTAQSEMHKGNAAAAQKHYERALSVAKKTKSPNLIARSQLALCEFGVSAGKGSQFEDKCTAAAKTFDKLGIPDLAARSNAQLAGLYHAQGQLNKASAMYSKVIQRLEKTGVPGTHDTPAVATYRANLCQVEMSLRSNGAHYLCKKALEELEKQKSANPAMLAATHYGVGVTAGRDGWAPGGLDHLNKAVELSLEQTPPDRALASDAMLRRGIILGQMKNKEDEAAHAFKKGIAITEQDKSDSLRATRVQLRTQLAQLQLEEREWKTAKGSLEALIEDAKGDPQSQAWAYSGLARAELKLGDKKAAKKALQKGLPLAKKAGDKELVSNFKENLEKFEE